MNSSLSVLFATVIAPTRTARGYQVKHSSQSLLVRSLPLQLRRQHLDQHLDLLLRLDLRARAARPLARFCRTRK